MSPIAWQGTESLDTMAVQDYLNFFHESLACVPLVCVQILSVESQIIFSLDQAYKFDILKKTQEQKNS